jgi:hypothetical protein
VSYFQLEYLLKGKDGRKEVAGGGLRRTSFPTCFTLPTMGKLHICQNINSYIERNGIFFFSFLKHLFILFAGQIKVCGGLDPACGL